MFDKRPVSPDSDLCKRDLRRRAHQGVWNEAQQRSPSVAQDCAPPGMVRGRNREKQQTTNTTKPTAKVRSTNTKRWTLPSQSCLVWRDRLTSEWSVQVARWFVHRSQVSSRSQRHTRKQPTTSQELAPA